MALALIATPGDAAANTYATIAEADAYHESHVYADTWNSQSLPKREQALVWATRLLDQCFTWNGVIAASSQALRWPRSGAYTADGVRLANTAIPRDIVRATAELARWLLSSDRTAAAGAAAGNITQIKVGDIGLSYGEGGASTDTDTVPLAVRQLVGALGRYAEDRGSGGAVSMGRG